MTIHKEGKATLLLSFLVLTGINATLYYFLPSGFSAFLILSIGLYLFLVSFFRKPIRIFSSENSYEIVSPCDGKIVVIEEVFEEEYLKQKCKLVSVFMSPLNVHINYFPCQGEVSYSKYHPGKYLAAWNPKSSTENERTSIGLKTEGGEILLRQVAGALARRIVCYAHTEQTFSGGEEMGFIKFGSRVDIYLPLDAKIEVVLDQVVEGCLTRVATLP
ncbi:MAG: phosphatidylserine decarboxylase family protein [Saprospiraceae bacterium]